MAECLAIEDSPNGVLAAKSAGMRCVAVPDPLLAANPRFGRADLVLDSLTAFDQAVLRRLGVYPAARSCRCQRRPHGQDNLAI